MSLLRIEGATVGEDVHVGSVRQRMYEGGRLGLLRTVVDEHEFHVNVASGAPDGIDAGAQKAGLVTERDDDAGPAGSGHPTGDAIGVGCRSVGDNGRLALTDQGVLHMGSTGSVGRIVECSMTKDLGHMDHALGAFAGP
jgi:hypothetical protein